MWNPPTQEHLSKLPALYETEPVNTEDKIIYLHFFICNCDWYIAEYDGEDLFFGYANLGDPINAEWGYISFSELSEINVRGIEIDNDQHWRPKPFSEISK